MFGRACPPAAAPASFELVAWISFLRAALRTADRERTPERFHGRGHVSRATAWEGGLHPGTRARICFCWGAPFLEESPSLGHVEVLTHGGQTRLVGGEMSDCGSNKREKRNRDVRALIQTSSPEIQSSTTVHLLSDTRGESVTTSINPGVLTEAHSAIGSNSSSYTGTVDSQRRSTTHTVAQETSRNPQPLSYIDRDGREPAPSLTRKDHRRPFSSAYRSDALQ